MADWTRQEHHQVIVTGPAEPDAGELIRRLHEAISDWRQLSGHPPNAEVPAGVVTVRAGGAPVEIRIEVRHAEHGLDSAGGGDRA